MGEAAAMSLYEVLEIGHSATREQIEASYRRIAAFLTPRNPASYPVLDAKTTARLRAQVREAYETLADPGRRAAYDRHLGGRSPRQVLGQPGGPGGRPRLWPQLALAAEGEEDVEFSGPLLRKLRESAAATLDDVSELTKISKRYLVALEEHDVDVLPAAVYVRGYLGEYARLLGLNPEHVTRSYLRAHARLPSGP